VNICDRQDFEGMRAAGNCPDCGHMIMAHIGTESCAVCRMEWLISPDGQRQQARIHGAAPPW
jgi:hypothetical protein